MIVQKSYSWWTKAKFVVSCWIFYMGFRSYFKGVLWAHTADFGCPIIDNELFFRNPVVTYVSEMTNFLFFGKNTLTQVSYHSKTTFATKWGRQNHYLEIGSESFYNFETTDGFRPKRLRHECIISLLTSKLTISGTQYDPGHWFITSNRHEFHF